MGNKKIDTVGIVPKHSRKTIGTVAKSTQVTPI